MSNATHPELHIPIVERLKSVPGVFGIRLGEQPEYTVIDQHGPIEVRQYGPLVLAKTTVSGPFEEASREAFMRLASYIFGHNYGHLEMPMTAPVFQEFETTGWTLSFILPKDISLEMAPTPQDNHIELVQLSPQKLAVIRYTGLQTPEKMLEKAAELIDWAVHQTKYAKLSEPSFAQYDSPLTIPFLRRNEAFIEVGEALLN